MWRKIQSRHYSLLLVAVIAIGGYLALDHFAQRAGGGRWIQSIAFSQDGRILLADVEHYLFVWEAETGRLQCSVNYSPRYPVFTLGYELSLAPSGERVAVNSYSLGTVIIDTGTCDHIATLGADSSPASRPAHMRGAPVGASLGPDERYAVAAQLYATEEPLHLYDVASGERLRSFRADVGGDIKNMNATATSPDGTRVAAAGAGRIGPDTFGGLAIVWDLERGEPLYHVTEPSAGVESVHFSPKGEWLLLRGVDGRVHLRDSMQGGESVALRTGCARVEATAFLPRDDWLLLGCDSDTVEACDLRTGNCEPTALPAVRGLTALAVHPDGERVAIAAHDGSITVAELSSGKRTRVIDVPRSAPDSGQYGPAPPREPPLEMFKGVLMGVGPLLWVGGLVALVVWLRKKKAWLEPTADPVRRTAYIGLRTGTWLTLAGLGVLVLAFVPMGPWMVFVIFPIAYATLPAFLLATALGLVVGAWTNRKRLSARQLAATLALVLLLAAAGAASMIVALQWVNEPK